MKTFKKVRLLTVLAGVFTSTVIVFTQVCYFEPPKGNHQDPETEQKSATSSSEEEETVVSFLSSYSLPSSTHVVLSHEFSFIKEILFDGEHAKATPVDLKLFSGRLFKALFHFIISPNAP